MFFPSNDSPFPSVFRRLQNSFLSFTEIFLLYLEEVWSGKIVLQTWNWSIGTCSSWLYCLYLFKKITNCSSSFQSAGIYPEYIGFHNNLPIISFFAEFGFVGSTSAYRSLVLVALLLNPEQFILISWVQRKHKIFLDAWFHILLNPYCTFGSVRHE